MDGLIPLLDKFVTDPDTMNNVSSVIPGRIYVVKGKHLPMNIEVRSEYHTTGTYSSKYLKRQ